MNNEAILPHAVLTCFIPILVIVVNILSLPTFAQSFTRSLRTFPCLGKRWDPNVNIFDSGSEFVAQFSFYFGCHVWK